MSWSSHRRCAGPARRAGTPDTLTPQEAQIARLKPLGEERHFQAGEIVFDQGDADHDAAVGCAQSSRVA